MASCPQVIYSPGPDEHKLVYVTFKFGGVQWRSWLQYCGITPNVAGSIPDGSFRPHYGSRVDSASNRNEYQGFILGGRGGRCVGPTILSLTYTCRLSRNSETLSLLEP
jgi:hypothetical protein